MNDPIPVPWHVLRNYRCFGCSPDNPIGLRLRSYATEDGIQSPFRLGALQASYPGIGHGGLVATVADEVMGNLLALRANRIAYTTSLRLRFLAPVLVDRGYTATARVTRANGRLFSVEADVVDEAGGAVAIATGSYRSIDMEQAMAEMDISEGEAARLAAYIEGGDVERDTGS